MPTVASLVAEVKVSGADTAKQQLSGVGQAANETQSGFGGMLKNALSMAGGFAIFNVGAKAVSFLKDQVASTVQVTMQHQQVASQTAQAIKSTGDASGLTAAQIGNMAASLSKVTTFSQDTIQSGQNILLTFTGIGKQTFPAATQAMLDMSQAMGMDTKSAAMQLGKALNDPLTGLTALSREGVTFSDSEKTSIKTMMAHNDVAGAQKIMLQELQKEFGGSAVAAGQTFGGQLQILKNNLDNVKISIGTALMPILSQMVGAISTNIMPALSGFASYLSSPDFKNFATGVGQAILGAFTGIGNILKSIDWKTFIDDFKSLGDKLGPIVQGLFPPKSTIFNVVGDVIKNVVADVGDFAKHLGDIIQFFKDGSTPALAVESAIIGIGIAIGLMKIGEFASAIPGLIAKLGIWAAAQWTVAIPTLATSLAYIAIGALIVGAIALIVLAVQHWGDISKWLQDRWKDVSSFFGGIWKDIQGFFGGVGNWFHDRWTEAANNTKNAMGGIGQWFGDRRNEIQSKFADIGGWFHDRFDEANKGTKSAMGDMGQWFGDRRNELQSKFADIGGWFHDRFQEAWSNITSIFNNTGKWFSDRWTDIMNGVDIFKRSISDKFNEVKTDVSNIFRDIVNGIIDKLNNGITGIENFVNFFGNAIDWIAGKLGAGSPVPHFSLGRIPSYAAGTDSHPGGPAIVGERGRELVMLPKGASVMPNDKTEALLGMLRGKVPGYADGIGQAAADFFNWVAGGAKSLLDNALKTFNVVAPNLPGLSNLGSSLLSKIEDFAMSWINKILPNFSAGPGGTPVNIPGNLQSWIAQAIGATGAPASWAADLGVIAMHESGGNPNAQNNWDINAQNGDPSRGLFQTIGATFRAYALPGHGNILNPVDNAIAAIRYIMSRYGDVFHVPGIVSMTQGGPYVGYANGGTVNADGTYMVGERGPEAVYLPRGANVIPNSQLRAAQAPQPVTIVVNVAGRNVAEALLPDITQTIRYSVGTHGM